MVSAFCAVLCVVWGEWAVWLLLKLLCLLLLVQLSGLLLCAGVVVLCCSVCVLWQIGGGVVVGAGVLAVVGEVVLSSVVCGCLCSGLFCVCSVVNWRRGRC